MTVRFLNSFEDVDTHAWRRLLQGAPATSVFCQPSWASTWWSTLGEGTLRVAVADGPTGPAAVVPFYELGDMLFLVGCVGADHLDLAWDRQACDVLEEVLATTFGQHPNLLGMQLHQLRRGSDTIHELEVAGKRLGLAVTEDQVIAAPYLSLVEDAVAAVTSKKSFRRHENWFRRNGNLTVGHLDSELEIMSSLPVFFDQHVRRWQDTDSPSLFQDPRQRRLFEDLVAPGIAEGWLRFTQVLWDGQPIAFHYGFSFAGRYLWYKPSFEVDLAGHSPGEVLLRHLIWSASSETASVFDFGLGDESFKARFASDRHEMVTLGIYRDGSSK